MLAVGTRVSRGDTSTAADTGGTVSTTQCSVRGAASRWPTSSPATTSSECGPSDRCDSDIVEFDAGTTRQSYDTSGPMTLALSKWTVRSRKVCRPGLNGPTTTLASHSDQVDASSAYCSTASTGFVVDDTPNTA